MRILISLAMLLLGIQYISFATDERNVGKGTVLNYTIKDGAASYKLKATVMEWNTSGNIKIQWQTTGAKPMKGVTTFPYKAIGYSTEMKVKLKAGAEALSADLTRWFAGHEPYDDLSDIGEVDLTIDDVDVTVSSDDEEIEKEVLYNKVKTMIDYQEGENTESDNQITIGFLAYNSDITILSKYVNGSFAMNLVSIETPVTKTADDFAKDILKAIAPKGSVPVKKMEAKKFAAVKSKYPLLATIENYDGTKGGTIKKPITETYEYRYNTSSPNPPSPVDCLTADVRIIYNQKDKLGITDITEIIGNKSLPATAAKRILDFYMVTDFNKVPGYRPWTHWSFVRTLNETQRTQLATELEGYVAQYGFITE